MVATVFIGEITAYQSSPPGAAKVFIASISAVGGTAAAPAATVFISDIAAFGGAANVPPTATVSSSVSLAEAGQPIRSTAVASDADGTVTGHTWRVSATTGSLPTPTLSPSGLTCDWAAPAGLSNGTVTIGYKPTDNSGVDGVEVFTTVSVLASTRRVARPSNAVAAAYQMSVR